jgi:hypothetical protein
MHHDLDAVAASALVGVADELDVARRYRIHGLPLPVEPPSHLTVSAAQ